MLFESPASFLTFVFGAQNSCFFTAQKVSWHLFLVPKTHVFLRVQWVSWHLFGAQVSCFFLTAPTFAFGAQNSCTGCLRARRVSWHLFLAPKTHCFLRSQRASWHLLLVCKTHVFGEPRRFPDICFGAPNSCIFLKSPAGFLIFVFGSKTHAFWEVPKTHVFVRAQRVSWVPKTHNSGELRRFPDICFGTPKLMLFWEPNGFLDICFWCPRLMCFFWQPRHLLLVHKTLVQVVWEPGEFPDICFWRPKHMFLRSKRVSWHLLLVCKTHVFAEPRRFPDICFCAQNSCIVLKSPAGFLTFVFWFKNSCFLRARRVSWPLFLVPKTHVFWEPEGFLTFVLVPNVMLCWEPNGSPDICFWCPRLMCFFYSPGICFWCLRARGISWHLFWRPKHMFFVWDPSEFPDICCWCAKLMFLESPEDFLTFVLLMLFWEPNGFLDICFWCPRLMCFLTAPTFAFGAQKASFLTFVFGAQNTCFWDSSEFPDTCCWRAKLMFLESPEGFLTFVLVPKFHALLRAQWVSWRLFLVPKTHVFLTAPTFAFGAQNSCTGCLRARRVSWHLFLTFVFGAQNTCFWSQRVSWHLLLVSKTHVFLRAQKVSWHLFWCPKFMYCFKEPGGCPDICFLVPKLMLFESPASFLTFVFGAQNSCFLRAQKVSWHLFWCPNFMLCWEPSGFPDVCFWCPRLMFFWQPRLLLLVHKTLVQVVWEPGEFPDICFWHLFLAPKTHVFFWDASEFPDICCWCPKLMCLESPEGFLTFVLVPKIHVKRARRVSWYLSFGWRILLFERCPKLMFLLELSEFPECPRYIILESPENFLTFVLEPQNSCFFESPMGILTFVFGAQDSCFFFDSPDICFWCANSCTGLFESPASFLTFVFGAQNTCLFFEIPASFLTFVVGVQNSCFWRAQKVPDICFGAQNSCIVLKSPASLLTFVFGAQNSCCFTAQKVSWHLFLGPKLMLFFESPMGFLTFVWCPRLMCFFYSPDICFWCTKLLYRLFESPASFLTFVFGAQNTCCFWDPNELPDICCWCPKLMFLESPEGFLTFVLVPKIHVFS